jgi:xanthine dehydrogenase accessory factor
MESSVFRALAESARRGEQVALGIIAGAMGSSPQKVGAKAVFYPDGRIVGTLGGGCLEAEIQKRAIGALRTGKSESFELLLDHDFGWDDGLICGGKVFGLILPGAPGAGADFWQRLASRERRVAWGVRSDYSIQAIARANPEDEAGWRYRETVCPPCALWVAGAGHIARAVAPLALRLDFRVTVFDDRPALTTHQFFPTETELKADTWDRLLTEPLPEVPTFGLIVTRGHRHDALVLSRWIKQPFSFVGMIGSRRKARTIFDHFLEERIASEAELARVACPVGIPIQSRTVDEIAVSILAQYIEKRAEAVDKMAVSHE